MKSGFLRDFDYVILIFIFVFTLLFVQESFQHLTCNLLPCLGLLSGRFGPGLVFVRSPFCQNTSVTTGS